VLPILWIAVAAFGCNQARIGSNLKAPASTRPLVQVQESEMAKGNSFEKNNGGGLAPPMGPGKQTSTQSAPPSKQFSTYSGPGKQTSTQSAEGGRTRLAPPDAHGEDWRRYRSPRSGSESISSFLSQISKTHSHVSHFAQEIGIAEAGSNTFFGTIVNIITGGLGAGILCLPWAAAGASMSTAIVIIGLVLIINAYTINILVQAADERKIFDIAALLGELPGSLASVLQLLCNIVVWITMFLSLISYFIVITDCFVKAVKSQGFVDEGSSEMLRSATLVVAALVLAPLCFLDQDKLAYTSTLTVIVNIYVFSVIGTDLVQQFMMGTGKGSWKVESPVCLFGVGYGSIAMCATMMQCVTIQMCVLPMYAELKDPSPKKFRYIVNASFSGLFLLFSGFAVAGVLAYGEREADENVLNNLGTSVFDAVAQGGMVLCIMSVYPIMVMPMVAPLKTSQSHRHFAGPVTIGIVVFSCAAAFPLRSLGLLSIVCGSLSVGIFCGLIPGLVGYFTLKKNIFPMTLLAVTMVIMTFLGLIWTDNIYEGDLCFAKAW